MKNAKSYQSAKQFLLLFPNLTDEELNEFLERLKTAEPGRTKNYLVNLCKKSKKLIEKENT